MLEGFWRVVDQRGVEPNPYRVGFLQLVAIAETDAEAEQLYEQVVAKYGDIKGRRLTMGERAKAALHEMRDLAVGKMAPEIQGEDSAGKPFRLSDYRGKVVVLDFWGHW